MADQIVVSQSMLDSLNATRPWAKFLAIVGFVMVALMVIVGLAMLGAGSALAGQSGLGGMFAVVYLLFAVLYFMPCLFLFRYAKAIAAIPASGQAAMENALGQQKSFWKFMGVLTLVLLCIYVIGIVAAIVIPVMMGAGHHP